MAKTKGSRVIRHNLGAKHILCIRENNGFAKWSIRQKKGTVVTDISTNQSLKKLLIIKSDGWYAQKENGCSIVLYCHDFDDAVIGLLCLFHEIGHLVNWNKFTWREKNKDERSAWAFSIREIRRLEKELEVKFLTHKRYSDFKPKIRKWISNHKSKN